jgi:hypothetical protein
MFRFSVTIATVYKVVNRLQFRKKARAGNRVRAGVGEFEKESGAGKILEHNTGVQNKKSGRREHRNQKV